MADGEIPKTEDGSIKDFWDEFAGVSPIETPYAACRLLNRVRPSVKTYAKGRVQNSAFRQ